VSILQLRMRAGFPQLSKTRPLSFISDNWRRGPMIRIE
jgi:hypothetical protein